MPDQSEEELEATRINSRCSLRGIIWKLFLRVKGILAAESIASAYMIQIDINVPHYTALVCRGPAKQYDKIQHDLHRTFKHDSSFGFVVVPTDKLSRCLNAFAHSYPSIGYVQGMNAICGTLLYVLPEVEAFYCFSALITEHCSQYMTEDLPGVHAALDILGQILQLVDSELYDFLKFHQYKPPFLMHAILSLGTGTPPLTEVLKLWDFYLAFGLHMNVVCTAARLLLMRDTLLSHASPCSLLRTLPKIHAESIISLAVTLSKSLPQYLYELLIQHSHPPQSGNNL